MADRKPIRELDFLYHAGEPGLADFGRTLSRTFNGHAHVHQHPLVGLGKRSVSSLKLSAPLLVTTHVAYYLARWYAGLDLGSRYSVVLSPGIALFHFHGQRRRYEGLLDGEMAAFELPSDDWPGLEALAQTMLDPGYLSEASRDFGVVGEIVDQPRWEEFSRWMLRAASPRGP